MTSSFYHDDASRLWSTDCPPRDVKNAQMTKSRRRSGDKTCCVVDTDAPTVDVDPSGSGKSPHVVSGTDAELMPTSWRRRHLRPSLLSGGCTTPGLRLVRRLSWNQTETAKVATGCRLSFTINAILGLDDDTSQRSHCDDLQCAAGCFNDRWSWVSKADCLGVEGEVEMSLAHGHETAIDMDHHEDDVSDSASVDKIQQQAVGSKIHLRRSSCRDENERRFTGKLLA